MALLSKSGYTQAGGSSYSALGTVLMCDFMAEQILKYVGNLNIFVNQLPPDIASVFLTGNGGFY